MITGYNTDIKHADVVFHVQTEDKGLGNPVIESLVYVGGQVLAAKRSSYEDIIEDGKGEKSIAERMDQQHRVVIRAIKKGKFDTKMEKLLGRKSSNGTEDSEGTAPTGLLEMAKSEEGPSLDQVILDYLTQEVGQERLVLTLGDGSDFGDDWCRVEVHAGSSNNDQAVKGAQVNVKLISTVAEPVVLAMGTTNDDGFLAVEFELPRRQGGSSMIIITASSIIGSAEIKRLV